MIKLLYKKFNIIYYRKYTNKQIYIMNGKILNFIYIKT